MMETFAVDKSFYDIGDSDLKELWDSDLDPAIHEVFRSGTEPEVEWCAAAAALLQDEVRTPPVVFRDRLMTDAVLGNMPIKTEHSYSLSSDGDSMSADSPISLESKMDDMEEECFPAIPMNTASSGGSRGLGGRDHKGSDHASSASSCTQPSEQQQSSSCASSSAASSAMDATLLVVKDEPLSTPSSPAPSSSAPSSPPLSPGSPFAPSPPHHHHATIKQEYKTGNQQSLLKQPTILLAARSTLFSQQSRVVVPKINIKLEPSSTGFSLPPTPPSSSTSDNEGNLSPIHHQPSSPAAGAASSSRNGRGQQQNAATRLYLSASGSSSRQPIQTPLISSQPGSTGVLMLTEEEKRTLLAEGYPIPTRLPLTKAEEKSLKKIRRKIKNKISAQESRRKKKEYMDALEKKVENLSNENSEFKKKIESLEGNNASLLSQLQKLQALVGGHATSSSTSSRINRTAGTQTAGSPSLHLPYPVTRSSIK
ncbi:cyclic AMP response element-binding protein A-like isoform X2 [Ischnura elegans]|uniref:cyclic AMP response element-binding protein A-like isoform X2 n=1 Tax=Ischnura elegans TaxID=197161 RepID=UPI001ED88429|nr:cyclic AMP response element-binding protein A-like isoform X2 [Ischnura elegans]